MAVGCLVATLVVAVGSPTPSPLLLGMGFALLLVSVRLHLSIRLGSQRVELTWSEAGLVLALALLPAAWVVLLTPVAVGLSLMQRRFAPIKIFYNIASCTVAAGSAVVVLTIFNATRPFHGLELLALSLAGVAAGVVTHVAVAAVIAVVQEVSFVATWRAAAGLQLLTLLGNLGVAIGVLVLTRYGPLVVAAIPVLALSLHQGYQGRVRGYQEREAGQQHAAAVGRLTEDLDEPGVLRRAAEDARELADVDVVDIVLPAFNQSKAVLYRHTRGRDPWTGDPAVAPPLPAREVASVEVPIGDGGATGLLRAWLIGGAPELRLDFSKKEALSSLATHTGAAIRNARSHAFQTYHATHDRLTGLPVRTLLIDKVEEVFRDGGPGRAAPSALLVVDIIGYRELIHTFAHDVAERLLVRTARHLEAAADSDEYVAHIGGNAFGIYLPDAGDPAHVRNRALQLLDAVAADIEIGDTPVTLRAAAGAAYSSTPVGSGPELLRQALVALDQARAANISVDFYDPGVDRLGGPAAVVMKSELRSALDEGQLLLHYQPIVHLPSGAPVAVETFTRWWHPTKGNLAAGDFMDVLEHSPHHRQFITWQLQEALRARASWGECDLPVSINLATRCLFDRTFPDQVADALNASGVPGNQLMLEIAESAVTQLALVEDVLTRLRQLDVRIAIDSLGADTISLTNLLRVPATHVKVHGWFTKHMLLDDHACAIVGLTLDLGRRAELHAVATGVSDEEQVTALLQMGYHAAQGPHLVPPMHAEAFPGYLAAAPQLPPAQDNVVDLESRRSPT